MLIIPIKEGENIERALKKYGDVAIERKKAI